MFAVEAEADFFAQGIALPWGETCKNDYDWSHGYGCLDFLSQTYSASKMFFFLMASPATSTQMTKATS